MMQKQRASRRSKDRQQAAVFAYCGPVSYTHLDVYKRQHPLFTRDGANVLCQMPISFTQAALGATIEVPTLDGKVRYNIPEGTQTGTTFRLRGKGIPLSLIHISSSSCFAASSVSRAASRTA